MAMKSVGEFDIERVRGHLNDTVETSLREFWKEQAALDDARARERLPRVLSRLCESGGRVVGTNSDTPVRVPAIANQWFHVYRSLIAEPARSPQTWMAMLEAACEIIDEERAAGQDGHCIGVLVQLPDESIHKAFPEAIWPGTGFRHAGYSRQGRGLRVRYFEDARIAMETGA